MKNSLTFVKSKLGKKFLEEYKRNEELITENLEDTVFSVEKDRIIKNFIKSNPYFSDKSEKFRRELLDKDEKGYLLFDLNEIEENIESHKKLNLFLMYLCGSPIWLYPEGEIWFNLKVKLDADPGRTHGVGENRLHVDLVGYSKLPRIISLYSIRKDKHGKGSSLLSDLNKVLSELDNKDRELLNKNFFKYWPDKGVLNVGDNLNSFSIIDKDENNDEFFRFTSKMSHSMEELLEERKVFSELAKGKHDEIIDAFKRFSEKAESFKMSTVLEPGELLIFNQVRLAHGRGELGENQSSIPVNERRRIRQCYAH